MLPSPSRDVHVLDIGVQRRLHEEAIIIEYCRGKTQHNIYLVLQMGTMPEMFPICVCVVQILLLQYAVLLSYLSMPTSMDVSIDKDYRYN